MDIKKITKKVIEAEKRAPVVLSGFAPTGVLYSGRFVIMEKKLEVGREVRYLDTKMDSFINGEEVVKRLKEIPLRKRNLLSYPELSVN